MKDPQLSRAADLPTMCRTIGAARMAGSCTSPAMLSRRVERPTRYAGRERPGPAPPPIDNQETR
ncbi:hypothetical protein CFB46_12910 [Burkholderia sp. HI2761]|nr:hypothetical protein [Burkholderia sp. BE24]OXJ27594.1 hypothetical protein CFB46_12910 [Burkholderia sp. HI2761]